MIEYAILGMVATCIIGFAAGYFIKAIAIRNETGRGRIPLPYKELIEMTKRLKNDS